MLREGLTRLGAKVIGYSTVGRIADCYDTLFRQGCAGIVAMPLIRYRTGGHGYLTGGRCACGNERIRLVPQGGRICDWYGGIFLAILGEMLFPSWTSWISPRRSIGNGFICTSTGCTSRMWRRRSVCCCHTFPAAA